MTIDSSFDQIIIQDANALTDDYISRHRNFIAPSTLNYAHRIVLCRAEGTRFWDVRGKEYLDFDASVAVAGIGHNHPWIAEMDRKQQETLDFAESGGRLWCFTIEIAGTKYEVSEAAFAEVLIPLVFPKATCVHKVIPSVSGKQAVEIAAALTFKSHAIRPGKNCFVAFEKQFSGRLGWAGAFSYSKPVQKKDFPHPGFTIYHLPFPETYEDFKRAEDLLNFIPLDSVSAVLYEYIQGEGGMNSPAQPFFHDLLTLFRERGAWLICDEIQSGLGRTGKWFSFQHDTIIPDIVLVGKALGAGIPLSAVVYCASLFEEKHDEILESGWLGGTFHGYPKGIARALLVLDIMKKERLVPYAARMGKKLGDALHAARRAVLGNFLCIPKGLGLMRGLEFKKPSRAPESDRRNKALEKLLAADPIGILTLPAGLDGMNPTIRFLPPLIVRPDEIKYVQEKLSQILGSL